MKITTDLTGTESAATRHARLKAIYDFYFGTGAYVAAVNLGAARAAMNGLLSSDIANGESFASWLVKANWLNESDNASRDLDFTTGSMPAGLTFTRASTATYFNSAGVMQTAAVDTPRLDYDPATLQIKGLLIEGARTNILLNSATLATQSVTTTAQAYTLTFWGTGSVDLSGAYTGSLAGTGASNRVSLTFTPTAGSLTATVTGSVTNAQIEAGAFATSYIPTTGSAATRAADNAVMTGTAFSDWYNQVEGTFSIEFSGVGSMGGGSRRAVEIAQTGSTAERMFAGYSSLVNSRLLVVDNNVTQADISASMASPVNINRIAASYAVNSFAQSTNGATAVVDTAGALPTVDRVAFGSEASGASEITALFGHVRRFRYFRIRLSNTRLQELSA